LGGSITSPDGRLTLTIPQNALAETVEFAIQPVTNKFGVGLGLAYRLDPDGKTFTTPLEISVHYDDHDLEGTFPEALSLAYQDKEGAWHMQKAIRLDKDKKTITVSTAHFSVWTSGFTQKISPSKATVRVGESLGLTFTYCNEGLISGFIYKLIAHWEDCKPGWGDRDKWKLVGEGKLTGAYPQIIYTAPGKKPMPNVATVSITNDFDGHWVDVPCGSPGVTGCQHWQVDYKSAESVITIVDRGYRASGRDGPTSYSGVVCSLDKPFTITGNNALVAFPLKFVPSSGTAGTLSYSATYKFLTMAGAGTYTIEGADTDKPRILAETKSTLSGMGRSSSGGGPAHIDLTPLDTDECKP
jgi:hypothetical protein